MYARVVPRSCKERGPTTTARGHSAAAPAHRVHHLAKLCVLDRQHNAAPLRNTLIDEPHIASPPRGGDLETIIINIIKYVDNSVI